MTRPTLYAAITNHGFGHATRMASVLAAVQRSYPDILIIVATQAPHWLLEAYLPGPFIHRPQRLDVGVIQSDSLTMDLAATRAQLEAIRSQQSRLVAAEVEFIRQNHVSLLLGDIPPLAAVIARQAGIPGWMMGNFGWDFIYQAWGEPFTDLVAWIQDCFSQSDRLFRLPFHEPMAAFPQIQDVGLTGGTPHFAESHLREQFDISTPPDRTVLLTFGGLGLQQIPYSALAAFPDWCFITFDRQAPSLPNLRIIQDSQYRPVDFMPLSGRLVSKPGYSTFAEACRQQTPILTLPREDFAEAALLIEGMKSYVPHQILDPVAFFQGNWDFLNQPLLAPIAPDTAPDTTPNTAPNTTPNTTALNQAAPSEDGNATLAEAIGALLLG